MNYLEKQACNNAYNVVSGWLMALKPLELIEQFEKLGEPVPRRLYDENDGACRCCGVIVEENEECPVCGTRNDPLQSSTRLATGFSFTLQLNRQVIVGLYTTQEIPMTRKEFKKLMVEKAGIVRHNEDGWYCTVCHGKSDTDNPWDVKHQVDCTFCVALAAMTSLMPKQDFTPEVENQEISSLMQSYYTQLSTEDLETASTLTEKMLRAYTPRHRAVVAKEIRKWLPTIDFELIQSLVDNGFKNRAAASKFRNYLIFEFVSRKELAKLSARLEEIVKERDRMDALFGVMYDMPKKQEDPIDF